MGFRGCCSYPHGQNSMCAMFFGILAYILTINATYRCNYWAVDTDITQSVTGDLGIGLFSYQGVGADNRYYCFTYTEEQIQSFWDGPFTAGYAFAILANMCIGISMILLFIVACCNFGKSVLCCIGLTSILGCLFMALTFVAYASFITESPFNGTFSVASGLAIGTSIAALITGILICSAPLAKEPLEQNGASAFAPGTITTTETVLPDGSKKITKTTVNPDGSQTVTETVEHAE